MNILILNWRDIKNPLAGGAEVVTLEHAKAWSKKGHTVYWLSSHFKENNPTEIFESIHIIRKGNFITLYLYAIWFYLFAGIKFDFVVDEIHGIPFFTPFYVRKPKIAFIHEIAGEIWDYMWPFPISVIGKFMEKVVLFPYRNTPFITVSNSTKSDLLRHGIPEENITICINGLKGKLLTRIPEKEKVPTFLFVSRVVRMKGIEEVIKAFSFITRSFPESVLWVVGGGEENYISKLKKMADDYGVKDSIHFWGVLSNEEKIKKMRRAHILLHASVKEGWGLVVAEAASQATPSVVYDVPGLRDSVKNNKTGIIVSKNSPQAMAEAAYILLKNKKMYQRMQKECLLFAKSLSWETSTNKSSRLLPY